MISIDLKNIFPFVDKKNFSTNMISAGESLDVLHKGSGKGNDFLGWVDLPGNIEQDIIDNIKSVSLEFRDNVELVVVIGIGGSYLGTKAVETALGHNFPGLIKKEHPRLLYAGQNLSEDYLYDLQEVLENKEFGIVIISKSGTTTEPAVAFRILKQQLENKIGKVAAAKRIIAVTDSSKGALRKMADEEEYRSFIIPDDVGGRFSVLTPVGLLPLALAGIDIEALVKGSRDMAGQTSIKIAPDNNPALLYAAARNTLYGSGKLIELLVNFEPALHFMAEWWKQLYGESEGKEGKGIYPASVDFTTDLHSMGQYLQEGKRHMFETVLSVKESKNKLSVPKDKRNLDGLNYIAGKSLTEVNSMAELGTMLAHIEGGVPNIKIGIDKLDAYNIGQLLYFFEKACGISGYMLGVNPFDQPGVEAYKKNMFALLGKPGFEKETDKIRKELHAE